MKKIYSFTFELCVCHRLLFTPWSTVLCFSHNQLRKTLKLLWLNVPVPFFSISLSNSPIHSYQVTCLLRHWSSTSLSHIALFARTFPGNRQQLWLVLRPKGFTYALNQSWGWEPSFGAKSHSVDVSRQEVQPTLSLLCTRCFCIRTDEDTHAIVKYC